MAGTITTSTIQNDTSSPPTFRNNSVEIGTLCRAWVNFNGTGTVAIRASFNVSSITDNATGYYTVNMTNALPDINYCITGSANTDSGAAKIFQSNSTTAYVASTPTTSSFTVLTGNNSTPFDSTYIFAAVFR